jgi:hypothetical protein
LNNFIVEGREHNSCSHDVSTSPHKFSNMGNQLTQ